MVSGIPTAKIACKRVFLQGQIPKVGRKNPYFGGVGLLPNPFFIIFVPCESCGRYSIGAFAL